MRFGHGRPHDVRRIGELTADFADRTGQLVAAATAAVSTLVDASFEAETAPSALVEVWPELPNRVAAVDRIALAPSVTVLR